MGMKIIRIFLASSIVEFKAERSELEAWIHGLNRLYVRKGVFFEIDMCEDMSNALSLGRKQDEFNQSIRESRFFCLLLGREAGDYTLEEFETALDQFRRTGAPQISTFFHVLPGGELPAPSVLRFIRRLEEEPDQCYRKYTHLDDVKLHILLDLVRCPGVGGNLEFREGWALVDGRAVLPLGNIPGDIPPREFTATQNL